MHHGGDSGCPHNQTQFTGSVNTATYAMDGWAWGSLEGRKLYFQDTGTSS